MIPGTGLGEVFGDLEFDGTPEVLLSRVGGDDDDGDVLVGFSDSLHRFEAVDMGHGDIQHEHIVMVDGHFVEYRLPVFYGNHVHEEQFQCLRDVAPDARFVFGVEDRFIRQDTEKVALFHVPAFEMGRLLYHIGRISILPAPACAFRFGVRRSRG